MHGAGHCTAGRLEALGRWLQDDVEPGPVLRDISHLKLVFEGHALRQLKAYLYARGIERRPLQLLQALACLQAGYPGSTVPSGASTQAASSSSSDCSQ